MGARDVPDRFLVAFSLAGEQRPFVLEIAKAVEEKLGRGTVFLDQWYEHFVAGSDADLKLQKLYRQQCELVVVCVSQAYGDKPWTRAEHAAIRARQMELQGSAGEGQRILPIRVGDGDVDGILFNAIVPDFRKRSAMEAASLVVDRLRLIAPDLATASPQQGLSWPEAPSQLRWSMANHRGVRDAFALLLTSSPPCRFLGVRGPTEVGKSHITRQMLVNALHVAGLACGRFDFKGTADMESELNAFVQDLGVPAAPETLRLNGRLGHILNTLKERAQAALLIFDTYEAAGDAQGWVEKQLLPCLVRAKWLRVVIAGQSLPTVSSILGPEAARVIDVTPPEAVDWFTYGKEHRPGVTLSDVEAACRLAFNKASLLGQLLGPMPGT